KDVPRKQRGEAVERAMHRCGLDEVKRRVIGALSKGFRPRGGLAQGIVHDPAVLILDEPTVGLDPIQIREIRSLIADLAAPREGARGHTIVLSTHILAEVEAICRRVIIINRGKKVLDTPLAELTKGGARLEDVFARAALRDAEEAAGSTPAPPPGASSAPPSSRP